jgi:hypothetical protein
VACSALHYFSALSHKCHYFWKKVIKHKICVLIFCTTFVENISNSKKRWAWFYHHCTLDFIRSTHYTCQILMELEFSWQIFKKIPKYKKLIVHWAEAVTFDADRETDEQTCDTWHDMTKLIVPFGNFADAPENGCTVDFKYWSKNTPLWMTVVCRWRQEVEIVVCRLRSLHGTSSLLKADSWLSCQSILCFLLKPKEHYCIHKCPPLVPILCLIDCAF